MADERITPQGYDYPHKVINPFWGITEGGTDDYEELENKPKINGVELIGDKSLSDLGIVIPNIEELTTEQENALITLS